MVIAHRRHGMAGLLALLLLGQPFGGAWWATPARGAPSDAEEEANCARVSQVTAENAAPVMEALERLARERYGRGFSELTPEQVVQLSLAANVEGRQMSAAQEQMAERCAAYQQRQIAKDSATGGFRSLFSAQGLLDRWGRERLAGLGCSCPGFQPSGEDVDHLCPASPVCPGQQGGPRIPDPQRGCPSLGASLWMRQQLIAFYRILGVPPQKEEVRDVRASLDRPDVPSVCAPLPVPAAPQITLASLSSPSAPATKAGSAYAPAIASAAACFASPSAPACQNALADGDALVVAAKRAGNERCLGYALTARTLWALGADPRFTDQLIRFPEASRLRNEARIALRYLRMDCRGV